MSAAAERCLEPGKFEGFIYLDSPLCGFIWFDVAGGELVDGGRVDPPSSDYGGQVG